jgi:hypothetical protein
MSIPVASVQINDGDWFVIQDGYRVDVQQAIKVTAQMVFYSSPWSATPVRLRTDKVVFSSPNEDAARKLAAQLKASHSTMVAEKQAAIDRQRERDARFIAIASGAMKP